ncbi:uncharacterized protein LOC133915332 isoform X1 [Phragmites australis]|uniref:uncharacterized protein LOC133915332 isoform X1 n=1 Tax=Phragmites australis TaxID=29695 RepID=UPI002D7674D8|nr:uncharacterized protein LOC133915332 isoform X1 [Phragmites australis]
MSSMTSTQSTRPAARSSSTPSSDNVRPHDSGSSARSTAASQPPPAERSGNSLRLDGRTIHFSINAWILVVASLGVVPILPNHISSKAYRLSLLGTICSSMYSLFCTYGKPRAWNMPAIQPWLQSIIVAKDFVHLMFSLMMFTSNVHFKVSLLPVLCWALDHVARFLRHNFTRSSLYRKYLEDPCLWVETNNTTLSLLCSNAEITQGSRRNIIQTFMYFHVSYPALNKWFSFYPHLVFFSSFSSLGNMTTPCFLSHLIDCITSAVCLFHLVVGQIIALALYLTSNGLFDRSSPI